MTYFVVALTNDRAKLIARELQTNHEDTAIAIRDAWTAEGYLVNMWQEA